MAKKRKKKVPKTLKINVPVEVFVSYDGEVSVYVGEDDEPQRKLTKVLKQKLTDDMLAYHDSPGVRHVVWVEAEIPTPEAPPLTTEVAGEVESITTKKA